MATFMARSAALAGVIAAGLLCVAPARAACPLGSGGSAFAGTAGDVAELELTFSNGTSTTLSATTQGDVSCFGAPNNSTNYLVGVHNSASYVNYFEFTLPSENAGVTVSSATLVLAPGMITSELEYTLWGPTAAISQLSSPSASLYAALGTGTMYGMDLLTPNTSSLLAQAADIMISLNGAALLKLDAALGNKFLISGSATPIPEPSTWIMMLAGFAGLGFLARRRAVRRRAAAAAD
jgi:hypothetical protein